MNFFTLTLLRTCARAGLPVPETRETSRQGDSAGSNQPDGLNPESDTECVVLEVRPDVLVSGDIPSKRGPWNSLKIAFQSFRSTVFDLVRVFLEKLQCNSRKDDVREVLIFFANSQGKKYDITRSFSVDTRGFDLIRFLRKALPSNERVVALLWDVGGEKRQIRHGDTLRECLPAHVASSGQDIGTIEMRCITVERMSRKSVRLFCKEYGYDWKKKCTMDVAVESPFFDHTKVYTRQKGEKMWMCTHMSQSFFIPLPNIQGFEHPRPGALYSQVENLSFEDVKLAADKCISGRYNTWYNNCQQFSHNVLEEIGATDLAQEMDYFTKFVPQSVHDRWSIKEYTDSLFPDLGRHDLRGLICHPF